MQWGRTATTQCITFLYVVDAMLRKINMLVSPTAQVATNMMKKTRTYTLEVIEVVANARGFV